MSGLRVSLKNIDLSIKLTPPAFILSSVHQWAVTTPGTISGEQVSSMQPPTEHGSQTDEPRMSDTLLHGLWFVLSWTTQSLVF